MRLVIQTLFWPEAPSMRTPSPPRRTLTRSVAARTRFAPVVAALLLLAIVPVAAADEPALAPPQIGSAPQSPANVLAPQWSFSAPGGATLECSLTRGDTLVGDWAPCTSPAGYD